MGFLRAIVFIGLALAVYQFKAKAGLIDEGGEAYGGPEGSLMYFETHDGNGSLTLYDDRLEVKFEEEALLHQNVTINVSDIVAVQRHYSKVVVASADRSRIEIEMSLFGRLAAEELEEKLNELRSSDEQGDSEEE